MFIVPSAIRLGSNVVYATPTFIMNAKLIASNLLHPHALSNLFIL